MAITSQGSRAGNRGRSGRQGDGPKPEPKILFQTFFKSVGPRTYASQVKELSNGNRLLVLTEGKRDEASGEVRKTRLFVFAEDFTAYFKMLKESAEFLKANPLPEAVRKKRDKYWAKKREEAKEPAGPVAAGSAR